MTDTPDVPPIPAALAHLPTVGGLAVPWIAVRTENGRYLIGGIDSDRTDHALWDRLCGVCGCRLDDERLVLFLRATDLPDQCTREPGLHPACAAYSEKACPMVAGRLDHYRTAPLRLDSTMVNAEDSQLRRGAAAEPWFAVWVRDYTVLRRAGHLVASYAGTTPLRVRPITWRLPSFLFATPNDSTQEGQQS